MENKLKLDDPVGAISVHGVNGFWGVLSLGLFADGKYGDGLNGVSGGVRGLFYGDASQFAAQLIAIAVLLVWGFGVSYIFFRILDKVWGLRVDPETELEGLDVPEMGVQAYPDNQLVRCDLDQVSSDDAEIKQLSRFKDFDMARSGELTDNVEKAVPVIDHTSVQSAEQEIDSAKLTKVVILMKQNKFEIFKEAMNKLGITGMTVTQVLGCGTQKGRPEYYRGISTEVTLLPKVQVEIVVSAIPVRDVIETAKKVLYTGHIGDGKIFVYDVENAVKIRTGEEGYEALQGD